MLNEAYFRVASLNLWGRKGAFEVRMEIVRDEITKLAPDVIFLQEVLFSRGRHRLLESLEALGYSVNFAPTINKKRGFDYGNALLSRLKVRANSTFELSAPRGIEPRNVVTSEVSFLGRKGLFMSTHLSYGSDQGSTRVEQFKEVFAFASKEDFMILGGDLNMEPKEFQRLRKEQPNELNDVHGDKKYEIEYAKHVATNANSISRGIYSKLDYLVHHSKSGIDLKATKKGYFAFEPVDGVFPSDHIGIYGDFNITTS